MLRHIFTFIHFIIFGVAFLIVFVQVVSRETGDVPAPGSDQVQPPPHTHTRTGGAHTHAVHAHVRGAREGGHWHSQCRHVMEGLCERRAAAPG